MGITTFVLLGGFAQVIYAQIPIGRSCQADDCLLGFLPGYPNTVAQWSQVASCIDFQADTTTTTYISFRLELKQSTLVNDYRLTVVVRSDQTSTNTRTGCPSGSSATYITDQTISTSSYSGLITDATPSPTASSFASAPCPASNSSSRSTSTWVPTVPSSCNATQFSSVCECAVWVYPYSSTMTEVSAIVSDHAIHFMLNLYLRCGQLLLGI